MTEQEIKDMEYAKSLGYSLNVYDDEYFDMEYELTHSFDYEEKTKKYLETFY